MALTFFYREDRLALLARIASVASSFAKHTDVFFITNTKLLQGANDPNSRFGKIPLATLFE
jgi:hypothetical protein